MLMAKLLRVVAALVFVQVAIGVYATRKGPAPHPPSPFPDKFSPLNLCVCVCVCTCALGRPTS